MDDRILITTAETIEEERKRRKRMRIIGRIIRIVTFPIALIVALYINTWNTIDKFMDDIS